MPFPVDEVLLEAAETQLGRKFPEGLRGRLLRNNGGEVLVRYEGEEPDEDEDTWALHPVWDSTDKRRMKRTVSHIVKETQHDKAAGAINPPAPPCPQYSLGVSCTPVPETFALGVPYPGNMAYYGGHVQVTPKEYLVYWG